MDIFKVNCYILLTFLAFVSPTIGMVKQLECHQTIVADRPIIISSNNGSKPRQCFYTITEPPNTLPDHIFQVSLVSFNLGHSSSDGQKCEDGYFKIDKSLFCGGHISPNTFLLYPNSKHRTYLSMEINPRINHEFQARIELLPRLSLQEKHPEMILATPGDDVRYSECDRVYKCLNSPGYCQITSPSFPGAYPRPINCTYKLKSLEPGIIIGGRHELFEIGNNNKFATQNNCDHDDYIAIYDNGELISKFCGKTKKFPRIISKTSDISIQFISKNAGMPSKGFVLSIERSPPHITDHANCLETIKVSNTIQQIKSPHHWIASKSNCTYTLLAKPGKQIWLLINNIKTRSNCSEHDDYVSIYDGDEFIAKYCKQDENITPIVSRNNKLNIVYNSPNGTLDATSKFHFIARFSAVNTIETGVHVRDSWCDTIFSDVKSGPFSLLNPRDLILFMKNNTNQTLVCKYSFIAPESYTVRLQLDHTSFEPLHRCNSVIDSCNSDNYDKLLITEKIASQILGCECGARKHAQIFHSKGSEMIVKLSLNLNSDLVNSSLKYSPELYQFNGRYQFISPDSETLHCGNYKNLLNSIEFPTNSDLYVGSPILCHWKLQNISISTLKLTHFNISNDCKQNFIIISYDENEVKLCNGDKFITDSINTNSEIVNIYLISNKGQPQFKFSWTNSIDINEEEEEEEEEHKSFYECYGVLTLALFMAAAAICTMTIVLAVALVIWRYRESVKFTWRSRGRQRYSSVTRNITGAFW